MEKQNRQTADGFTLLGLPHAFDFGGDMGDIRVGEPARAQQSGLLIAQA
jgi:hypothetical protein